MTALGRLELVFSGGPLPALEQSAFCPQAVLAPVVTHFGGRNDALGWTNATISFAYCLVDYRIWAQTHTGSDYQLDAALCHDLFATLCNLLDSPHHFVRVFECEGGPLVAREDAHRRPLLKEIFLPPYRGAQRQVRIQRELLPPEAVVIKRGDVEVLPTDLLALREAIRSQYRVTGQGKAPRHARHGVEGKLAPNRSLSYLGDFELRTPIPNNEFFEGPLDSERCWMELGLAERQATDGQWERVFGRAAAWLQEHPDDLLVRASAVWFALDRGNFRHMSEVVKQTAAWVLAGDGEMSKPSVPRAQQYELDKMSPWLAPDGPLSEWHLEDNLVRAVLFRWLRAQGRTCQLGRTAGAIKGVLEMNGGPGAAAKIAPLLEEPHVARVLGTAAEMVLRCLRHHPPNNLLRVACLWIIGRRGQPDEVNEVIRETASWLHAHPEETLVRTAWVWLTGFRGGREQAEEVIEDIRAWLEQPRQQDECMARSAWLWLVGVCGSDAQADAAIGHTAAWLQAHPEDAFIRVANLLFLVKRRGNEHQAAVALEQARDWLARHQGTDWCTSRSITWRGGRTAGACHATLDFKLAEDKDQQSPQNTLNTPKLGQAKTFAALTTRISAPEGGRSLCPSAQDQQGIGDLKGSYRRHDQNNEVGQSCCFAHSPFRSHRATRVRGTSCPRAPSKHIFSIANRLWPLLPGYPR